MGSSEVNKVIRRILHPEIKAAGFSKVRIRRYWRYLDDRIWHFMIKSVGYYFSEVTGFPPQSLVSEYGIYFLDFPPHPRPALRSTPPYDKDGLMIPKEYNLHFRRSLRAIASQEPFGLSLANRAERERNDVWWISTDGLNVESAVEDLGHALIKQAIPDLENVDKGRVLKAWTS